MRSWDNRGGFGILLAVGAALWLWSISVPSYGVEGIERLDVQADPAGGVRGKARVIFPVKPDIIQAILTDYAKWPELFETRMRVVSLAVEKGVATTDVRIDHALLPGERRLVSETRVLPEGGMVTDLKSGDFKRYHREWRLTATADGRQTSADFELLVEIKSMLPDWLVAMAMRNELETHFKIVRLKALARAEQEK